MFSRPSATCNPFLHTINPDGTQDQRLTTDPVDDGQDPSWSPDGSRIVFERSTDCDFNSNVTREIFLLNADGSGRTQLTNDQIRDWDPTWLPTGTRIAWGRQRQTPNQDCSSAPDIAAMNSDRTAPTFLTFDQHEERDLDWHPSDSATYPGLVFGKYYFWVMWEFCEGFDGGGAFSRTGSDIAPYDNPQPDHAPDGDGFVIRITTQGEGEIALYGRGGAGEQVLTQTPGIHETYPVWSPDGRQIAYLRQGDIWMMNADGSNQHPITSTPQVEGQLDWQPVQRPYVHPKATGAHYTALVQAFEECTAPNRDHGPPLAHPSCNPPTPTSPHLATSSGETRLRSAGFVRVRTLTGVPGAPDDSDVRLRLRLSNVMTASDFSDYTGVLRSELTVRLTDRDGFQRQTTQDFPFGFDVSCAATASTTEGATCDLVTTADAVLPGSVPEGTRAIWQLGQVKVYDGGPAGDGQDASLFAVQGVFVP